MSSGGDFDKTSSVNRNKENISIWDCFDNVDGFFGSGFDKTTGDIRNSENENIWARYDNVSGILDTGFVKSKHQDAMVNFVEQNYER